MSDDSNRFPSHYFRFGRRREEEPQRLPLLEQLLARADGPAPVTDWRADAFRLIAATGEVMPGLGAAALFASQGKVKGGAVFVATPVHYEAEMSNVRLAADGLLSSTLAEAAALALDFNRVWDDAAVRLVAAHSGRLFFVFDGPLAVSTQDPELAKGRHIEKYFPSGADAAKLRRLMSETEMWLFEHAINRTRTLEGQVTINGLWPWAGGEALSSLPMTHGTAVGDDVFVEAFGRPTAAASLGAVFISTGPPDLFALQHSVAALRRGSIARIELSAGERSFIVTARAWRRFWRRAKPWWESVQ